MLASIGLVMPASANTFAGEKDIVILGTATPGGGFPVYGDAFAETVNQTDPTLHVQPRNTQGSTQNVPLHSVRIQLQSLINGNVFTTYSDAAGFFSLAVPEGIYLLTATFGMEIDSQEIQVHSGPNPVSLTMRAKETFGAGTQYASTVSTSQLRVPQKARNALEKAREAARKHNRAEVARYTDKALQLCPQYAEALAVRGTLELNSNPKQALVDTEKAVEFDPNYGAGYISLGNIYTKLGRFDEAIHALDRAIAIMPASWEGYFEMSMALAGKRDYMAALHQIERAWNLVPENYPLSHKAKAALHLLRSDVLIGLRDYSAAVTELEACLKEDPNGETSVQARRLLDRTTADAAVRIPTGQE